MYYIILLCWILVPLDNYKPPDLFFFIPFAEYPHSAPEKRISCIFCIATAILILPFEGCSPLFNRLNNFVPYNLM
jgi:hypothetical protein